MEIQTNKQFSDHAKHLKDTYGDLMLGYLCWYSVHAEAAVEFNELETAVTKAFANCDVVPSLPNLPRSVDIFKRACTRAELKKVPTEYPDLFLNFLIRSVGHDSDTIWRSIVVEQVDSAGHRVSYTEVCNIGYERDTSKLTFAATSDVPPVDCADIVESMQNSIRQYLRDHETSITAMSIRSFIRSTLEDKLHSIQVRPSGGVYFVHAAYSGALEALEAAVGDLGASVGTLHSLPLLDDGKQKQMLKNAFEDESVAAVENLAAKVMTIVSADKKISTNLYVDIRSEYDAMRTKVAEYSDLLDEALEKTAMKLEVANKLITKLLDNVK